VSISHRNMSCCLPSDHCTLPISMSFVPKTFAAFHHMLCSCAVGQLLATIGARSMLTDTSFACVLVPAGKQRSQRTSTINWQTKHCITYRTDWRCVRCTGHCGNCSKHQQHFNPAAVQSTHYFLEKLLVALALHVAGLQLQETWADNASLHSIGAQPCP
jgi:hypothetical protein